MKFECSLVLFCPVVGDVAFGKIEGAASLFDGSPSALPFWGNLIPISPEVRRDIDWGRENDGITVVLFK